MLRELILSVLIIKKGGAGNRWGDGQFNLLGWGNNFTMHLSKYHNVYLKYTQCLLVNHTLREAGGNKVFIPSDHLYKGGDNPRR